MRLDVLNASCAAQLRLSETEHCQDRGREKRFNAATLAVRVIQQSQNRLHTLNGRDEDIRNPRTGVHS